MRNQLNTLFFFILFGPWCIAQTDDCMAAPELIVVDDCLRSPGSTKGLIENTKVNTCGGNADDDGWFKFTAISERTQISVSTDQLTDIVIGAYQNCSIELGCVNGKGVGGQEILQIDTKIGDIYFIQVYEAGDGGAEFLICVSALGPIECLDPIIADFDIQSPNCANPTSGSIEVNLIEGGITPYTFQINDQNEQTNPLFSNLTAGDYTITIKNTLNCQFDTLVDLSDNVSFNLDIGEDLFINQGESINLQAISDLPAEQIEAITWSGIEVDNCIEPCQTVDFTATNSGIIRATLTTIDGCQVSDDLELIVLSKANIFVPNVFSPNGDGINDFFIIFANAGVIQLTTVSVFNRLGGLVFESSNTLPNDKRTSWDGRSNKQQLSAGAYAYVVVYETQEGLISKITGTVTLLL